MKTITVNTVKEIHKISPILYGIFFEDINYAVDGGLYSELIANRSFEYFDLEEKKSLNKMCWEEIGNINFEIMSNCSRNNIQKHSGYLKGEEKSGLRNLGFCKEGFALGKDDKFQFFCYAKTNTPIKVGIQIVDKVGKIYEFKEILIDSANWSEYKIQLEARDTFDEVFLEVVLLEAGELYLDYVSLTPIDTYKNRENGLRKDLVEMLEGIKPKFIRFPGGCIVEGRSFSNMYNWKDTIGSMTERKINWNRWQLEEYQPDKKDASDYFQSFGIGYYEYFLLCEDLGAKPVPVMNVGMTCQWHESLLIPLDELEPWIQDVLDLIEFANGSEHSTWGKIRSEMGHREPFNLEYIAIGNEQWGSEYFQRYELFHKVISEKHPDIKLITSAGWTAEGKDFDYAIQWLSENKNKAYAVDEHFYKSPNWFLENINRYDNYDRTMPKIFAGEYAAHTDEKILDRKNNWFSALTEAAFLTGIEKNSDHVIMSCYAPLIARSGHQQWQPNLIWFDKTQCVGTPNYYVQKLFSNFIGDNLIETITDDQDLKIVGSMLSGEGRVFLKVVNISSEYKKVNITLDKEIINVTVNILCADLTDENTFENPKNVYPRSFELDTFENEQLIDAYSIVVYDFKILRD